MDKKPRKSLKPIQYRKPTLKSRLLFIVAMLIGLVLFENCSVNTMGTPLLYAQAIPANYFKTTSDVTVEVYYEAGAEPYTGNTSQGRPYWGILETNLEAIFQYRSGPVNLNIPTTLGQMTNIPLQAKSSWSAQDLVALHQRHFSQTPTTSHARFYIYFLNGNFSENGANQNGVLGVSIGGTPILAIFKDVIQTSGVTPNGPVAKFVEQSTLVHEMGHALGFVNNGVPMVSAHQDSAHGAHTLNSDCVMYYLNEGVSDVSAFVQRYLASSSVVMWGPEVLADAENFSR